MFREECLVSDLTDLEVPPTPPRDKEQRGAGGHFMAWVGDIFRTWGPALLAVFLIRSVLAEPFRIPSGSMVPTLEIGDHIVVTKSSYGFRIPLTRIPIGPLSLPERGDIVVFVKPGTDDTFSSNTFDLPFPPFATLDYVKRVVGLPGDVIEVRDNQLYINGEAMSRSYEDTYTFINEHCRKTATRRFTEVIDGKAHEMLTSAGYGSPMMASYGPAEVPEGQVFVMGDNRDHSSDSRVWGYVPLRNIKGKAQMVWLSYDRCQNKVPLFGEFRGDRAGSSL